MRRSLTPAERAEKDARILAHIRSLPVWRNARRIALFFCFDGEPDLSPLIDFGQRREFFAPVLFGGRMHFAAFGRNTPLVENFFGIPEPDPPALIDPRSLDLVLTPLVAFDRSGNRLGVGAGYYDRCFSFLLGRRAWRKPKLVGTAYSLQQFDAFEPNPWDVPLWGAVTEDGFQSFG